MPTKSPNAEQVVCYIYASSYQKGIDRQTGEPSEVRVPKRFKDSLRRVSNKLEQGNGEIFIAAKGAFNSGRLLSVLETLMKRDSKLKLPEGLMITKSEGFLEIKPTPMVSTWRFSDNPPPVKRLNSDEQRKPRRK